MPVPGAPKGNECAPDSHGLDRMTCFGTVGFVLSKQQCHVVPLYLKLIIADMWLWRTAYASLAFSFHCFVPYGFMVDV